MTAAEGNGATRKMELGCGREGYSGLLLGASTSLPNPKAFPVPCESSGCTEFRKDRKRLHLLGLSMLYLTSTEPRARAKLSRVSEADTAGCGRAAQPMHEEAR